MNIIDELNAKVERDRASARAVARACGVTVKAMDKDTRKPDPDPDLTEVRIVLWGEQRKVVRVDAGGMIILTIRKQGDRDALIELPIELDRDEAHGMATAVALAAKVARYLDELEPDEALDAIKGLPTTPYDGPWPTPRAGRTEN